MRNQNVDVCVDLAALSAQLRAKRGVSGQKLRDLSALIGVSPTSLSRLERWEPGQKGFNLTTVAAVAKWLGGDVSGFLPSKAEHHAPVELPIVVATHLQKDRRLQPKTARALGEIFRLLYEMVVSLEAG